MGQVSSFFFPGFGDNYNDQYFYTPREIPDLLIHQTCRPKSSILKNSFGSSSPTAGKISNLRLKASIVTLDQKTQHNISVSDKAFDGLPPTLLLKLVCENIQKVNFLDQKSMLYKFCLEIYQIEAREIKYY